MDCTFAVSDSLCPLQAAIPADDSQLLLRVLEDTLSKLDLLENMQSLQDNSSTDELSQRIGVRRVSPTQCEMAAP